MKKKPRKVEVETPIMTFALEIMKKVQISMYISGLHKVGGKAIEHYTRMELQDRFALMCVAFDQPQYKVDKDLNIIEEN